LATFVFMLWLIGGTGCVSRITANRIIAAPNRFPSNSSKMFAKVWKAPVIQTNFFPIGSASPVYRTIPVGPPDAKLKAIVISPRDCHLKMTSKVGESKDGKSNWLSLQFLPQPTNTFVALKEPATIVILHGYMLSKESMMPWAFLLAQAGYRVVLVDLRKHGESTGWQISFGKYETADLSRVLDYLIEQNLCDERVGVLGLSYGATLALHWAAHDSRVRTVVAIAPYNQPDEAMERFAKEMKISLSQKSIHEALTIAATKLKINWTDWSGETAVRQLKEPILIIGAEKDTICPPKDIEKLKQLAPSGSKHIQISKANHMVIGLWFHELAEPVISWFGEHLERAPNPNERLLLSEKTGGGDSSVNSIQQSPK
jgi:pimeloyl-ACP methyl ester carboxylesterase